MIGFTYLDVVAVIDVIDACLQSHVRAAPSPRQTYLWSFVMPRVSRIGMLLFDAITIKGKIVCEWLLVAVCSLDSRDT